MSGVFPDLPPGVSRPRWRAPVCRALRRDLGRARSPDTYRFEDLGDRVLTLTHMRGRGRDGIEAVLEMGHVWTFREGLIARMDAFADPRKALEVAGLPQ